MVDSLLLSTSPDHVPASTVFLEPVGSPKKDIPDAGDIDAAGSCSVSLVKRFCPRIRFEACDTILVTAKTPKCGNTDLWHSDVERTTVS